MFTAAGLTLPQLKISFTSEVRNCRGRLGLFNPTPDVWTITICSDLAFVIVHEMAHAWIHDNVDERQRLIYTKWQGKASWANSSHDWNDRGMEDAAFVIQQNLMIRPTPGSDEWQRRINAYEFLTGCVSPARDQITNDGLVNRACRCSIRGIGPPLRVTNAVPVPGFLPCAGIRLDSTT